MKHGIETLRGMRYKIRMMGIPLSGPTYIYGDNKSQVTNSSRPELTLKKKCNSICYHAIHESVAMGETLLTHIRTGENLADFLTKTTSGAKCHKLVKGVVVGTLEDGYIQKVPLPRVPRVQSASLAVSAMIHKNPAHTGYLPIARIPVWSNSLGLLTGLGSCIERCILPFSPVRLM